VAGPAIAERPILAEGPGALLRTMWLIRAFEERVSQLVAASEVHGLVHLGIGQEAVAAGVSAALRADDRVYSNHRAHGHFLARGSPPGRVMAELMGRDNGLCRGKGGSMHLVDVERGLLGATGVVGGTVPLAIGTALVVQAEGRGAIAVVYFGDGAAQAGHFLESLNLASLWRVPVLLVCENNGYAEFTPRSAHTRVERVADLAAAYGIEARVVDGNDVLAVAEAARELAGRCRAGSGPALLECLTYRLRGHYEGDPAAYRDVTELREWRERDPIARLQATGRLTAEDGAAAERDARATVEAAVRFAREGSWPGPGEVVTDVHG